jgi:hypothetical protein
MTKERQVLPLLGARFGIKHLLASSTLQLIALVTPVVDGDETNP